MQIDFFEDQTVIQHYTIIDILEDVGGLWALLTFFLTIFFGFLILVYIVDLVKFIRANYTYDLEYYQVMHQMEKLQKIS